MALPVLPVCVLLLLLTCCWRRANLCAYCWVLQRWVEDIALSMEGSNILTSNALRDHHTTDSRLTQYANRALVHSTRLLTCAFRKSSDSLRVCDLVQD